MTPPKGPEPVEPGISRLMPFMVREILLVSTLYDSFILEEDGPFSDKLFNQYMELNLTSPPRMTRASTGRKCIEQLTQNKYDLVILMARIADIAPHKLAERIKAIHPDLPVVMLVYEHSVPPDLHTSKWDAIDWLFVWKGDSRLLLALVKSVEDARNVGHDTSAGLVRTIILIEDSPHFYSSILGLMYTEIMEQTRGLIADGINYFDRMRRMRARPKILLATNYEEGAALYRKYKDYVLGVISDVRMPRDGVTDPKAGLTFLESVRNAAPRLPILMQSAESEHRDTAHAMRARFADKNAPDLLGEIRQFMRNHFGFGEFVFRDAEGNELDRAGNMQQMRQAIARVDANSLTLHANNNHISNWLMARGEFPLAVELQRSSLQDFEDVEALRQHLLESFETFLESQQRGRITEFSRGAHHLSRDFVRLGGGSLGGKGRGVAFIYTMLAKSDLHKKFPGVKLFVPRTTVICTNEFDRFVDTNDLRERAEQATSAQEIASMFLKSRISNEVHKDLEALLEEVRYPLAVRSSSLLEDSQFQPFAGVYATHMLPNNDPSLRVRLRQLRRAIKLVYASTFFPEAKAYMRAINRRVEEEKMAILIQRLVGHDYGERFYPTFSGVAQSYNYYPVRYMTPEDGIAHVALGLGRTVVGGGKVLRFSPAHPQILPQMSTPEDAMRNSQRQFFACNMTKPRAKITLDEEDTLLHPELSVAESDGSLAQVGATYSPSDGRVYDSIYQDGVRLVNFAPILKYDGFPLAKLLSEILALGRESMGCPVEMEFVVNLKVPEGAEAEFAVVQIRPLVTADVHTDIDISSVSEENTLLQTQRALGNGVISDIHDIVYIHPDRFDSKDTIAIAAEVAQINNRLFEAARPYILIGPGRWGTSDRFLGIPVNWTQVSAARIIVELAMEGFDVDPSHGTHFFHNITSLRVGYLSVDNRKKDESVDWDWLEQQEAEEQLAYVRHVRTNIPLEARLDGRSGQGLILKKP